MTNPNVRQSDSTDDRREGEDFAQSLAELTPDQMKIRRAAPKKKPSERFFAVFRLLIIVACLGVFVYCSVTLVQNLLDYAEAQDYYDKLVEEIWNQEGDLTDNPYGDVIFSERDYFYGTTADYASSQSQSGSNAGFVSVDSDEMLLLKAKLGALYAQNNDFIAWITIPDTIINYPVVLTDDNEYYLNHNFQGDFLIAGTIFADYRNSANLMDNYNTILYGHNVQSGTMFSSLGNYFTKSFFNAHPYIYLYTMDGIFVYEVFNVSKVSSSSDYIRTYFKTPEDFVAFAEDKAASSVFVKEDLTFTGDDRILTLSTCTNAHNPAERYCIQAILVEVRK
ncbi:MAG: class B sortase [Eubacteriales bacterium]